jgi:hypothetical protein
MKKRLSFTCWNCQRVYSFLLEFSGLPKLSVFCPFCNTEGIVDLAPYLDDVTDVFRCSNGERNGITALKLPERIPTRNPEETDNAAD